jgi:ParB/RepB/Spo0J family partition protein
MVVSTQPTISKPPGRAELLPQHFDTERIVTPADNPVYSQAMLADLLESVQEFGQLSPGWVCPSPELPAGKLLCLDGNRRLATARLLGLPFWAFLLPEAVSEAERIRMSFCHNFIRRRMSIEEIAQQAARYITLTGCTQEAAAKHLNVSPPTLSRAFGDTRILPHLKERANRLGLSIRALIAAMPITLMEQALIFAEMPGADGKKPIRDQVAANNARLKKRGTGKNPRIKTITLRLNGRAVTLTVGENDSSASVAEDLKAIVSKLGKHADVLPNGWPFLFA